MIGGTLLVLFYAPIFFTMIGKGFEKKEHELGEKEKAEGKTVEGV